MGEVVLAGRFTAALAPVVFVTRPAWLELAAALPGVVEARAAAPGLSLQDCLRVIDLQGSFAARLLIARAGGRAVQHAHRADLARRGRVWWKGPPAEPVVARWGAAAGVRAAAAPWIEAPPLRHAVVPWGLVPGSAWATKTWPTAHWQTLAALLPGSMRIVGGPDDQAVADHIAAAAGPRAEILCERGFGRTLSALATCRVVIGGDTGLVHLARALGRPTLTLFGATTSHDGLWDAEAPALERDLPCRPCSRHGGPRCPIGDFACMRDLRPEAVAAAAGALAEGCP